MIETALVLTFAAAGAGAALMALRAASGAPAVRWLAAALLVVAAANTGLYLWPAVADDPGGAARSAGIAAVLALAAWRHSRLPRAARRAAGRRRDGP